MPKLKPIDILERMPGNAFYFHQQEQTVSGYEFKDDRCIIITDKQVHDFKAADMKQYIGQFLPIPKEDITPAVPENYQPVINSSTCTQLRDIIMQNIKMVQQDKSYIPQASMVNRDVKQLIELGKAEILMVRTLKQIKS